MKPKSKKRSPKSTPKLKTKAPTTTPELRLTETFDFSRGHLHVVRDAEGRLILIEDDGSGMKINAWPIATLAKIAKRWEDFEKEKTEHSDTISFCRNGVLELKDAVYRMQNRIDDISKRSPRFGWSR